MKTKVKPIILLSDSQILFWRDKEGLFLDRVRDLMERRRAEESEEKGEAGDPDKPFKAAYIGASNGDNPEYYDIFLAAMQQIGINECRMLPSEPDDEHIAFLEEADLVLLAGGDVEKGWDVIKEKFQEKLMECYYNGALLMGISAGAVQLGSKGWSGTEPRHENLFDTLQIVPALIDVHDEENDWNNLRQSVEHLGGYTRGFGIPMGGAAVYHPDWSFEAVRHHLVEFATVDEELKRSLIIPSESGALAGADEEEDESEKRVYTPDELMNSGIIDVEAEPV
ncbi:MAG: type 1 glutamine amidotransferase-like domain-containing protein [bacterium]|nr:type 1 glutamine amidotransferase-like domain-containing protein [bacterium]